MHHRLRAFVFRQLPLTAIAAAALAATAPLAAPPAQPPAPPAPAAEGTTVVLASRSIGSRRGDPLDPRGHAALLVRLAGQAGGYIVQGGKEPGPRKLFGESHRVIGWAIPAKDPAVEFAQAVGGWWGEPVAREVPTRELSRWTLPTLTEARMREVIEALNREFEGRDYDLEPGPSSNSFVSRFLDRLGIPLPPLGGERLPGWGWRP